MSANKENKEKFYSEANIVKQYEQLRFSNLGGRFVHDCEQNAFSTLLCELPHMRVLDIPTGTGRMLPMLKSIGFESISAADFSDEMLKACNSRYLNLLDSLSKQDIYQTNYDDESFDVILTSRFMFHCDNQAELLSEMNRLLKSGGYLLFDTLCWSPRSWTNLFSKKLGGNIYTNSKKSIYELAHQNDFNILKSNCILIFPSFFYRFIPSFLIPMVKFLESNWPEAMKSKRVWLLKKK